MLITVSPGTKLYCVRYFNQEFATILECHIHSISTETIETIAKDGTTTTRVRTLARIGNDIDLTLDKIEVVDQDDGIRGNAHDLYFFVKENAIAQAEIFTNQYIRDVERDLKKCKAELKAQKEHLKKLKAG